MTDFRGLLRALGKADVRFILCGGVAATIHGSSRLTADVDVVYDRAPENLRRLVVALEPHAPYLRGAPPDLPFRLDEETLARGLNFTLTTRLGEIDLFGELTGGGGYANLVPHTIEVEVYGTRCRCLDLPTLIRVKRAAGRPRDLDALSELEAILDERAAEES